MVQITVTRRGIQILGIYLNSIQERKFQSYIGVSLGIAQLVGHKDIIPLFQVLSDTTRSRRGNSAN